jgi:4-amino-4-deoxy-L-arabinose transferase
MLDSYFLPYQQILIGVSFLFFFISIITFEFSENKNISILFLLLGTLIFKTFVITADEFINLWDEQYHALVAKNLSKDFFFPKLFPETILPYDYTSWTSNYIWVHKQPFFLMQMAVFIKLFGPTAFAIRFPSVLCFTLATFSIYKIGENTFTKRIGFIGALLFSMNYFFNEIIVGYLPTDHNDIVFMCYITASVWTFTEHLKNKASFKWIFLTALFSSFAVLTKWLPGYLVYGIWFVFLIQQKKIFSTHKNDWLNLVKSFCMALILPLCWQIYIYTRFPIEAAYEHSFNVKHITTALDGHGGDEFFYFESIKDVIGYYAPFIVLLGISLLNKYVKDKKIFISFVSIVIIVYSFFTYTATKMQGFPLIVFFIFFLGFGAIGDQLFNYFKVNTNAFKKIVFSALLIYCSLAIAKFETFQKTHTVWNKKDFGLQNYRYHNINWYNTCKAIEKELKGEKYVVFNCDNIDYVKLMFYTDYIGYSKIPDFFQINLAKIKNYKVAVINDGKLPQYILNDKSILKITRIEDRIVSIDTIVMKIDKGKFLDISQEGKIYVSSKKGSEVIVTTFANNRSQLKTLDGKIATSRIDEGGLVVFEKNIYEVYEQFVIEKFEANKYIVATPFKEYFVIPDKDIYVYTKRRPDEKLIIEFIKPNN